ncbi:MAG: acylase [Flavobacteriales bacterium]
MKKLVLVLFILSISSKSYSQINPNNIEIIRDNYGVPHIYAATDAEVAYGFAWAQAEDHFKLIQEGYLAGNGLLGKLIGLKGAGADFLTQLIQSEETVDKYYNTLDKKFIALAEAFAAGLNAYSKKHPEEILEKKLFPLTVKKLLRYTQLQLFISNEADKLVSGIVNNSLSWPYKIEEDSKGSNFIAISRNRTGSDETFLAINTHQPLEGPTSWYEAHLVSEEGTNIIGAAFPGTPCILTGANEYLGWTHTVNYPDKADVFALEMHPKKKDVYLVDGKPYKLEKFKAKLTLKFLGINIPIKKKFYKSIYGPTLKNKTGVYSVRTPSTTNITAIEQWWKMNKATNFSEFYKALEMKALPGYNIGYADRNDTIFYISNGKIPIRAKGYDWTDVVPGNTKETLWDSYYDIKDLPQVVKPASGFVYNANHSPFKSSSEADNPYASLYYQLTPFYYQLGKDRVFTKEALYEALKITKAHLKTYFNAERIQLGEFQKLVRGNKELPIFGLPDVVTAMRGQPYKDGKIKITHGESYIGLVRFTPTKTYYESVISFGNSRRPESPHYTDQMELYANFKTKTMSFDRSDVMKTAKRIYAPK